MQYLYVSNSGAGTKTGASYANRAPVIGMSAKAQVLLALDDDLTILMHGTVTQDGVSFSWRPMPGRKVTVAGWTPDGLSPGPILFDGNRPNPWATGSSSGGYGIHLRVSDTDFVSLVSMKDQEVSFNASDFTDPVTAAVTKHKNVRFLAGLRFTNVRHGFVLVENSDLDNLQIHGLEADAFAKSLFYFRPTSVTTNMLIDARANGMTGICRSGIVGDYPTGLHIETGALRGQSRDILVKGMTVQDCKRIVEGQYPQGDGFSIEGGPYRITLEDCAAEDIGDGGYDLKGGRGPDGLQDGVVLVNCRAARCYRSLRAHYRETTTQLGHRVRLEGSFLSEESTGADIWMEGSGAIDVAPGTTITAKRTVTPDIEGGALTYL